jgi:hypothetical protein
MTAAAMLGHLASLAQRAARPLHALAISARAMNCTVCCLRRLVKEAFQAFGAGRSLSSGQDSLARRSAAWRSRSSAVRNRASHTQELPAWLALTRCQAASSSSFSIVAIAIDDIAESPLALSAARLTRLPDFAKKPDPPFGLIDPDLEQTGAGDVAVLVT